MSTLERQLTSPGMQGPSRHLSGDQGVTFRSQQDPRRHLSGDQVNQVRMRVIRWCDDYNVTSCRCSVLGARGRGGGPVGTQGPT